MIAYLDNSATTRPSEGVICAMADAMRAGYYNPSSLYAPAMRAEQAINACREAIASAIGGRPEGVFFTSGGTEANNLAILGAAAALRGPRTIITTDAEHPSVLAAYEALRAQGHRVVTVGLDGEGRPDWQQMERALGQSPALISMMQVGNETGAVLDADRLFEMSKKIAPEALIHIDGVQGFLRIPFDVRKADLYTLSAHKLHGPKGVGAVYVRPGVRLKAQMLGGGQERGLRSGTENTPGIAGLLCAVEEMRAMPDAQARMRRAKLRLWAEVSAQVPCARVNGPAPERGAPHILNISFENVRGEVMLHALEGDGVYVSTGSACSSKKRKLSPALLAMGIDEGRAQCAVRFSLSPYTTDDEIDYAASRVGANYAVLSKFWRR
jgi:cysteine desulfurase